MQVDQPPALRVELRLLLAGEQPGMDLRVLMDQDGTVRAVRRSDEPQAPALFLRRKALLLVARLDVSLGRLDPNLQEMHGLAGAWIEFAMPHP
jgi:hypothetical protein